MSKIALTPNASGTGTLTIAAPNTNTDRTLTLPDAAGTVGVVVEGSYTPTLTPASGSITAYTATGVYKKINNLVFVTLNAAVTNNGTGAGHITMSLPFTSSATGGAPGCGRENSVTGNMLQCIVYNSSAVLYVFKYDSTYPAGTGYSLFLSIVYSV